MGAEKFESNQLKNEASASIQNKKNSHFDDTVFFLWIFYLFLFHNHLHFLPTSMNLLLV